MVLCYYNERQFVNDMQGILAWLSATNLRHPQVLLLGSGLFQMSTCDLYELDTQKFGFNTM